MNNTTMHPLSPHRLDKLGRPHRFRWIKRITRFAKPFAVRAGKTGHPMSPNRAR